jgi:membrane associated rhomboid family serine protease
MQRLPITLLRNMTWLDKLERRIGFLAIPGLLRYVGFLTALVFVLEKVNPGYLNLLDLDPVAVVHGEVWRLVTYIFIPQMASMLPLPDWLNVAFYVLFLWWMGNGLESAWGAFKLTIFYLIGDDRDNCRRIFLWRGLFQFHADDFAFLCFRSVLS